jgi:hypothetical protein
MGTKLTFKNSKIALTPEQEKFCQIFSSDVECLGNGTQSYIQAFNVNVNRKGAYRVAATMANRLLKKAYINARIAEFLDETGFNDLNVDKQLTFVVNQNADFSSKVAAIREYNRLKKRVLEQSDKPILNIQVNVVESNNLSGTVRGSIIDKSPDLGNNT